MFMFIPKCLFHFSFYRHYSHFLFQPFLAQRKTSFIIWKCISCHKCRSILREECNHTDQYQTQNEGFRVQKDEILTITVLIAKTNKQRNQRPRFAVDLLFIGIYALGLGSLHPRAERTLSTFSCCSSKLSPDSDYNQSLIYFPCHDRHSQPWT